LTYDADAIVVGAGLAGLVATAELVDAGRSVIVLDQEPEQSLGSQAFWSFGGLFLVDSPEQRRLRIRDSVAGFGGGGMHATARSKAPSSAVASSQAASPAAPRPRQCDNRRQRRQVTTCWSRSC
jgi:predicted oxidoreductase